MNPDTEQAQEIDMSAVAERQNKEMQTVNDSASVLNVIARAASDPNIDIDKFERLLSMQERVLDRQAKADYMAAMSSAQAEMRPISADAMNPQTRSNYATYAALDKVLRPIYTKHGFGLSFDTGERAPEEHIRVLCEVTHKSGYSKTHHIDMPTDGKGIKGNAMMTKTHAQASGMSYGMRYLLKMVFNVAVGEDDDDGNRAGTPPLETISLDQQTELSDMLKEAGKSEDKFLNAFRRAASAPDIQSLSDIPASRYEHAKRLIENNTGAKK